MIKKSKKMLSFLLAFLMVFSMFAAFAVSNASAATNPVVSVVSDDYSVKVGDTFNVSIVVNNGTYVADTVLMAARYNPSIFEYTGVSSKNLTYVGSFNPAAPAGAVGTGYIGFLFNKAKGNGGDMPTSTDFTMCTVQLRVKAGVTPGTYKVENSPLPATGAKILKHSSTSATNWGATITTYNDATITVEEDVPADTTPTVGLELVSGTTLKATIGNYISTQSYQVWVQQVDVSGAGLGWVLEKAYTDAFGTGNSVTFSVGALTPSYIVYVRYKGADNIVKQVSKQIVLAATATPIIKSLDVEGETQYDGVVYATATKTFNLSVNAEIVNGASMVYEWFNATSSLGYASTYSFTPTASGEYVITVKVTNSANDSLFASKKIKFVITNANAPFVYFGANPTFDLTLKNNYILLNFDKNTAITKSTGNTPKMRLALGEPFKGARGVFNQKTFGDIYTADMSGTPYVGGFYVTNPGIYSLVTYITSGDRNENEDYVVKSVTVPRTFGGTASLTTTSILGGDGTYTIKGIGSGLTGMNYQYSFWRVDANGHNLIKNWSSDDTLTWKPTQNGNYTIIVRVRGDKDNNGNTIYSANDGTYEAAVNRNYTIGEPSTFSGASLSLSATRTTRNPITITVNGAADTAVYSFSVFDVNRGADIIRGFAPSNECVWVPDKPGDYVVTAKINGQGSFGYADGTVSTNVTVAP